MKTGLVIVLAMVLAFTLIADTEKKEKTLTLEKAGLSVFEINCGSGHLKITGIDGLKEIEVNATLEVSGGNIDEIMEERVTLSLEKKGSKAVLISKINSRGFSFGSRRINLDIRVPKQMNLDVDDGSGLIEIFNIAGNIKLEDGSGSIAMGDITGDLDIEDGSGLINVENVHGTLKIDDGSGSIKVTKVAGDVWLDDNSGSLAVYDVTGSVVVDDGSGSILIDGVERDVTIKRAGSGGVNIKNVKGVVKK